MDYLAVHYKKMLIGIISAAFIASTAYSFYFRIQPSVDARAYDGIAMSIVEHGVYPFASSNRPGPGYEFFLAAIYYAFGHSYAAVWILQSALLAASAFLIFLASREIFGDRWHPLIGIVAAALVGLSPDFITIASMLMTEMLVIFLLSLTIYLFFRYLNKEGIRLLLTTALSLALAALVRGNLILLIVPIGLFFILRKKWLHGFIFLCSLIVFLTPWTVRNYYTYGTFMPFNASPGLLYVGNHAGATGELIQNYPLPSGVTPDMPQTEYDAALGKAGLQYILSHPLDFVRLTLLRISIYFSFARPFAFWPHLADGARLLTIVASSAYAAVLFTLGFIGTALAVRKEYTGGSAERVKIFCGMMLMVFCAVIGLIVETRYRFPIYPFLAVLAGFAVNQLAVNRERLRSEVMVIALTAGLLFGNTLFDALRNISRILERL